MVSRSMEINFSGQRMMLQGTYIPGNIWYALKRSTSVCLIGWLFALLFMFVPYVNISVPMVFVPAGPIMGSVVFFFSRRAIQSISAECVCG